MDNVYKAEIRELIKRRMLNDRYTNVAVRVMIEAYIKDMDRDDERQNVIDNILNEHFDEFMLTLFKIHFKAYDDTQKLLLKRTQEGPPPNIIVTTQEHYDRILEENSGRYEAIRDEVNRCDVLERENKELYKKIKEENNGCDVL